MIAKAGVISSHVPTVIMEINFEFNAFPHVHGFPSWHMSYINVTMILDDF